jgi:Mrp family chromosome partitioning ATPase
MTRIFEALKKSQGRAAALPFPPAAAEPLRAAVTPLPATPAAAVPAAEPALTPRVEFVPAAPLPDEVARELAALRVGIESALEGRKSRVVLFLSAMRGEGVTTVARQFASLLASDGRGRALLVDLHSRSGAAEPGAAAPWTARPSRGPVPEPPAGRGAATIGVASLGDEIPRTGGRAPAAVRAFFATASTQFDWVIVDGPPVLQSPESVHLASLADGVVLVVRSGHTKRPVVLRAAELLRKSGARVLGSVLNRRRLEIPDFIYRRI